MSRITHNDYYVRVTADMWLIDEGTPAHRARCNTIIGRIKRHVDEIGSVELCSEVTTTCSDCNRPWETDPADGCPLCCQAAVAQWETEQSKED